MTMTATATIKPVTFRLPKPGSSDPHFGFSRSFYYNGEERGWWKLIRIRDDGKERGVTLIPFDAVAAFVRKQMESNQQIESMPGGSEQSERASRRKSEQ